MDSKAPCRRCFPIASAQALSYTAWFAQGSRNLPGVRGTSLKPVRDWLSESVIKET